MKNFFKNRINLLRSEERGVVYVLLALLLVPIVIYLALALDTSRMSTSITQLERASDYMTLAALEVFMADQSEDVGIRKTKALERVYEIGGVKSNKLLASKSEVVAIEGGGSAEVDLEVGIWWFEAPNVVAANHPCLQNGQFQPCFEPSSELTKINAIRLSTQTTQSSEDLYFSFGKMFGEAPSFSTTSIAATIPRNGVFLIDMSRSIQFETHLPIESLPLTELCNASEYAFRLAPGVTCDIDRNPNCTTYCQSAAVPADCMANCPYMMLPAAQFVWNRMWLDETTPSAACPQPHHTMPVGPVAPDTPNPPLNPAQIHYRSNYECYGPFNVSGVNQYYMVEVGEGVRPEPLSTVFDGINQALQELQELNIAGDRIAFIAFDSTVPQNGAQFRRFGPNASGSPEFDTLIEITDTSHEAGVNQQRARINNFLFPATGSGQGDKNLSSALATARTVLTNLDNFSTARNFVTLFSNGISTCYNNHGTSGNQVCQYNNSQFGPIARCVAPTPENSKNLTNNAAAEIYSPQAHAMAMNEVTQIISKRDAIGFWYRSASYRNRHRLPPASCGTNPAPIASYVDLGIEFNYFALGNIAAPFSLLESNAAGDGCKKDEERRNQQFTMPAATDALGAFAKLAGFKCPKVGDNRCNGNNPIAGYATSSTHPYINQHINLYSLGTVPSRGRYFPLRTPCKSLTTAQMESACDAAAPNSPVSIAGATVKLTGPTSHQLLTCDPLIESDGNIKARTMGEQVRDGIREIYSDMPYLLVQ